jgi:3-dehydroquinate synthase
MSQPREADRNIVLTGFMGTGKTTVGREVAWRLGRPFVDMDREIEARAGKPVPRIFAEDGEAVFRKMEAELCVELAAERGMVIATGGGALIDPANRAAMAERSTIVCLTCAPEEILHRVRGGGAGERPLLDCGDPRAEIERLLAARRAAYAKIPWQVETTGRSVAEIAAHVIRVAGARTIPVRHGGGAYPIHIGAGLLDHVGGALRAAGVERGRRVAVVSNPVVAPLYADRAMKALAGAGLSPFLCLAPDGEAHKTLDTVAALYDQFLAGGLDRSGTVLGLGGGVTGDEAGFAAATYLRGVRLAQVPTTLLAMVDASVGGKTGVDLPQGKNLAGAFKQPVLVLIDPDVLANLPAEEVRSGMGEMIKHGVIGAPELFAEIEASPVGMKGEGLPGDWIARALRVKKEIVEQDPFEQGQRAVLNLGHTVGHAVETLSGYDLRHGEAVAIGMVAAARIAVALSRADGALVERIEGVLRRWGLPVRCPPFTVDEVWAAMAHDKKRRAGRLRWVVPLAVGEVEIFDDVPPAVVHKVLRTMGAR